MCALGLCMKKASGKSCSMGASTPEAAARATDEPPTVRPSTLDASPLSNGAGAPILNPEPQPLTARSMNDAYIDQDPCCRVRTDRGPGGRTRALRSEEHTTALQSLMRISYAVFC